MIAPISANSKMDAPMMLQLGCCKGMQLRQGRREVVQKLGMMECKEMMQGCSTALQATGMRKHIRKNGICPRYFYKHLCCFMELWKNYKHL